jgi:ABC-type branched-subunit amino acid transport system substrate-binding protein
MHSATTANRLDKGGVTRRSTLKTIGGAAAGAAAELGFPAILKAAGKVKLGFMTALTGLETILGETQLNCFKLAVEDVNAAGGAGGREIEYLVEDDQTTTKGAIDKARKLVFQDKVDAVIGMIASLERVAALSVTGPAKKLLIYTTYYEGGECNKYLVCTGQVPNQQIDPMMPWLVKNLGKSVYVMGSDYIWPRKSTAAVKAALEANGGRLVGAEFFPFGTQDLGPAFGKMKDANPRRSVADVRRIGCNNVSQAIQQFFAQAEARLSRVGRDVPWRRLACRAGRHRREPSLFREPGQSGQQGFCRAVSSEIRHKQTNQRHWRSDL